MTEELKHIPLEDLHQNLGAKMVDFAGWYMPVRYEGAGDIVEHQTVRTAVGVFDVSHMGELEFVGREVEEFLQRVFTNNIVDNMPVGQARYGMLCNEMGEIIDDDIVYKRKDRWGMVVNASKTDEVREWLQMQAEGLDVSIYDRSAETTLLALQGPKAAETIAKLAPTLLDGDLKYYQFRENVEVGGIPVTLASRTGYTGENGMEFMTGIEEGRDLWKKLMDMGVQPCGLGARDTLRTEAGLPLGGHEISRELDGRGINPIEAGLGERFVDLDKNFIGRGRLIDIKDAMDGRMWHRQLVGFVAVGREIPRPDLPILNKGVRTGTVTSGTFSPTLKKGIGMGYVLLEQTTPGTIIQVDVRGKQADMTVVPLPFYKGTAGRKMVAA